MSGSNKVAKRYARSLFELSKPEQLDAVAAALNQFVQLDRTNLELAAALRNPAISKAERCVAAQEVAKAIAPELTNVAVTVYLAVENGRVDVLPEIAKSFEGMVALFKKSRSLSIISARALSTGEKQDLKTQVEGDFGSAATLEFSVDPTVIGGMLVKAGDLVLDGTVRTSLEKMRASLMA